MRYSSLLANRGPALDPVLDLFAIVQQRVRATVVHLVLGVVTQAVLSNLYRIVVALWSPLCRQRNTYESNNTPVSEVVIAHVKYSTC